MSIKAGLAFNPSTPSSILIKLANEADEYIQRGVATNLNSPEEILESLAKNESVPVRGGVAINKKTPLRLLENLAKDEEGIRRDMASCSTCPQKLMNLFGLDNANVRASLATNPCLSQDQFRNLFMDFEFADWVGTTVRAQLVRNSSTPVPMLEELANDQDLDVGVDLASNTACPENLIRKYASTNDEIINLVLVRSAVGNISCPKELLVELSNHFLKDIREEIAMNTSTPLDILRVLSNDSEADIRVSVAGNTSCEQSSLEQLSKDKKKDVRQAVARNRSASSTILTNLAGDKQVEVRCAVAANPSTPQDLLLKLYSDKNESVRASIAWNSSLNSQLALTLYEES